MGQLQIQALTLIAEILTVYFLTRLNLKELSLLLSRFTQSRRAIFLLLSLIYFPGTVLHEMAHLVAALILLLPVKEIQLFPELKDNKIKLGHVFYEKKDAVRGILVGVAPIIVGVAFLWWLAFFHIFPSENLTVTIIVSYIIFAVSSTMFSSKQDLKDILAIIPFAIIVIGILYVFNIHLDHFFIHVITQINFYLLFSLGINLLFFLGLKILNILPRI